MIRLVYRPEAVEDIADAYRWYERSQQGSGEAFLRALTETEHAVLAHPRAYRVIHRDLRRALVRRFPYHFLFRLTEETITVVGCFHVRRSPRRVVGRA